MLRIEAYTVMDGLQVRLVGTCQTNHVDGGRCRGDSASALALTSDIEGVGAAEAVALTVSFLMREVPEVAEFIHH